MVSLLVKSPWGAARGRVSNLLVAATPAERRVGLSRRVALPPGVGGMLFVFDPPERTAFWMRETWLPLDIAFIDAAHVVRRVVYAAPPNDTRFRYESAVPSRYVVEVPAGGAAANGIEPGAVVTLLPG